MAAPKTCLEKRELGEKIWGRWADGRFCREIGPLVGVSERMVTLFIRRRGGVRPPPVNDRANALRIDERIEIVTGLAKGYSMRTIARALGRSPSTISREVSRNGGPSSYRALNAHRRYVQQAQRPKSTKLEFAPLRREVEKRLLQFWSPVQISHDLKRTFPEPTMQISPETLYKRIYIQTKGGLRNELTRYLRRKRAQRRTHAHLRRPFTQQIPNPVSISERPPEVADRAIPGHWEGDLLMGKGRSCLVSLVERATRYTFAFKVPSKHTEVVVNAIQRRLRSLPRELAKTLTWDQGRELAAHQQLTLATKIQVYFCDPASPWQRGTNENTNGLLRDFFPKGSDIGAFSDAQIRSSVRALNNRPRQTLNWDTPAQRFALLLP